MRGYFWPNSVAGARNKEQSQIEDLSYMVKSEKLRGRVQKGEPHTAAGHAVIRAKKV